RERISRLIQIQADKREDIQTCYSGDIAAIVGIKNITTGDTLCDEDHPILLEPPSFPDPVISMAIEPKTKLDQEKMATALQRLAEEDPTFRVYTHEDTGQTIIAGMGELHLEIIRDRMFREFKVDANAGKPQIAYRETITTNAHGVGKLIKQSGGRGQYGHVEVDLRPGERSKGLVVENITPEEYQGDIIGDLNRRRGQVNSIESRGNLTIVHAEVPLAELFGYATAIRSLSKGRSSYSMEPSHFQQVPQNLVAAILDQ